jgi:hypothetical protein
MTIYVVKLITNEFIIGDLEYDEDNGGVNITNILKLSYKESNIYIMEDNIFTDDITSFLSYDKIMTINNPSNEVMMIYNKFSSADSEESIADELIDLKPIGKYYIN